MIIIGLTGSMATGKSTIAELCKSLWHIPVWDADHEVRLLLESSVVQEELKKVFPDVFENGVFRRGALRSLAFSNPNKLRVLESILYPILWRKVIAFIHFHQRLHSSLIILDVPLLFEKGWSRLCNFTVVATCQPQVQRKRILQRSRMTQVQMEIILQQQFPQHEKCKLANFEIKTDLSKRFTLLQMKAILNNLRIL